MHTHNKVILDQFTMQADAFASAEAIRNESALELLLDACEASRADTSLDVACGPGIVVCAFAEKVRSAAGIDITPAMVEKGKSLAESKRLTNTTFFVGSGTELPFPEESFSIVTSRYAFHHFMEPSTVLDEMVRVGQPGAHIAVMDMVAPTDPLKAEQFNVMERLRDPSHVRALTLAEFLQSFEKAGLPLPSVTPYRMHVELEAVLEASFPDEGNRELIREMVMNSLANDNMGVNTRNRGGKVYFTYPVALLVSTIPVDRAGT